MDPITQSQPTRANESEQVQTILAIVASLALYIHYWRQSLNQSIESLNKQKQKKNEPKEECDDDMCDDDVDGWKVTYVIEDVSFTGLSLRVLVSIFLFCFVVRLLSHIIFDRFQLSFLSADQNQPKKTAATSLVASMVSSTVSSLVIPQGTQGHVKFEDYYDDLVDKDINIWFLITKVFTSSVIIMLVVAMVITSVITMIYMKVYLTDLDYTSYDRMHAVVVTLHYLNLIIFCVCTFLLNYFASDMLKSVGEMVEFVASNIFVSDRDKPKTEKCWEKREENKS